MNLRQLVILTVMFIMVLPMSSRADKASKLNKKGIEAYRKNNLDESKKLFTEALVEKPDSPHIRFNRGTALSTLGKSEEAISELERSANTFTGRDFSAAAYFNAGNTFFAADNLQGAIEEYKKAVKLDQSSLDIRHNLEFALRKLQEQQQQQQQQQNDDKKKKEDSQTNDEQNIDNDKENDQKQDEDENKDRDSRNDEQKREDDQQQQQQQQQVNENKEQAMSKEEAERLLDAIDDEEKKAFELRKMMMQSEVEQGDVR